MQLTRELFDFRTPREFEVMELVVAGMLNKQIAGELTTAKKTEKVHRGRVMQKLGVTSGPKPVASLHNTKVLILRS